MLLKATELKVHQAVHREIHRLLSEQDTRVPDIVEGYNLQSDLGFTSLELVKLVSALDANLHIDLLAQNIFFTDLRTVGDLIQAYQKSLPSLRSSSANTDELLLASRKRAQARRGRGNS